MYSSLWRLLLKASNKILIKYGLSNDAFPEIQKLDQENYLVILYPENDNFNLQSFIVNTIPTIIIAYGLTWIPSLARWVQTLF